MSAVVAVITRLEAIGAVTALVASRIYNGVLPQSPTVPAIRVQRIGEDEPMHLRGSSGVFQTRVQIDSVSGAADAGGEAAAVDSALRGNGSGTALVGWKGTVAGVDVQNIQSLFVRERYDADDLRQYRVIRDVMVTWSG